MLPVFRDTFGPICHWAYASQYVKTCFLNPSVVKKANLLLGRHLTVIENEYEPTTLVSDFIRQHDLIDADIQKEKRKNKTLGKIFLIIDILITVFIITIEAFLYYNWHEEILNKDPDASIKFALQYLPPIFDVVFALILAVSAIYLAKSVKRLAGKGQNSCLLSWHICNLLLLIAILAL